MSLINIAGRDGRSVGTGVGMERGGVGMEGILFFLVNNFVIFPQGVSLFFKPIGTFLRTLPVATPFLSLFVLALASTFCCEKKKQINAINGTLYS